MRYSLLSRFRGALLGSLVGESLGSINGILPSILSLRSFQAQDSNSIEAPSTIAQLNWSQMATCGIESLIQCGRLDLEDWQLHSNKVSSLALLKNTASSSEAALATLPIAVFFHDDSGKLRQQLRQAASHWQSQTEEDEGVLAVGYAIALALTEKLDHTLISQILSWLGNPQTPLGQNLQQVQNLIDKGASLDTAVSQLRQEAKLQGATTSPVNAIALAFYCFLSTPEDFRLSLSRASRISYQPQLISALTGAISGAYNSNIGIPVDWVMGANKISLSTQRQQAELLFAVWSGVYGASIVESLPWAAIAAPRVIRLS
jgi:hypothetical protein